MGLHTCPSDNTAAIDQSSFWSSGSLHWDAHRIGWAIAGGCTVATLILSSLSVFGHCRNYTKPLQQRQILRILYMPPVYAVISFLSYRFFRDYTYYSFIEVAYEAITLSAFLLLLIEILQEKTEMSGGKTLLHDKDKQSLIFPFCFWRYRPTKPYFMNAVKWSVLQYVIVRPLVSIVGMVCQALGILCESQGFDPRFANVYLEAIDFVSISVALYGLFIFYGLTKDDLAGKKPLAKFLCIKLIVMFTFYQSFVFSALEGRVIHATEFWTETNIANGLNALTICIEMIFFSIFMWWAYPFEEYSKGEEPVGSVWTPLRDSINYADFVHEIYDSVLFFINRKKYDKRKNAQPSHSSQNTLQRRATFAEAFQLEGQRKHSRS